MVNQFVHHHIHPSAQTQRQAQLGGLVNGSLQQHRSDPSIDRHFPITMNLISLLSLYQKLKTTVLHY